MGSSTRSKKATTKKLYEEEKYAEAKPAFEKFWKQSPSNSSYNLWYGVCCLKTGDLEAAEKPLSFAVKRRQIEAFRYMGDLCFLTYRMEEAVDMYEQYLEWLEKKPEHLEVVMSGRNPSDRLKEHADYISEIKKIKHPFDQGLSSRIGIEK